MAKQGNLANRSGNTLEKAVTGTLESKGFEVLMYRDWKRHPEKYGKELLLKNVPYKSIYNHDGNTEFLLKSEKYKLEIRIECKWQQSSGSVDEKFPYLYLNCIESMPEAEIILIVDGEGFRKGAVEWLKDAARSKRYTTDKSRLKDIKVFNLSDFLKWTNEQFR